MSTAQRARAKRAVRSKEMSERCEQTSKRTSKRPGAYAYGFLVVLNHSGLVRVRVVGEHDGMKNQPSRTYRGFLFPRDANVGGISNAVANSLLEIAGRWLGRRKGERGK